ncbi:ankyrin repeat protein, putative [Trichomonas vaginalis G3]|uniref:Ankyrin repeat protein, putative n=1 Tax=Trichomonas vaginalis (strain ATCC PRA-98 / G3) TaxID=412133 RepID=A2E720_TRIV3|nr:ankyrin repeat and SOCS box-containing protein 4 family [Trichomonas vaginalis G3]EAY11538.1 ankyrin repeat protein, putative [Trichomonas vaginalis G3]KAI5489422.1 ankyrin repeat and SOCS box-containing protein 4 family [Trichomonas vaginalis G3]|eukprot:XP_001323761.1 ankyrin repeat protein [Trichomonas vaginalis G3]
MSDNDINPNGYSELRNTYKYCIDLSIALYQLKTENEGELNLIYKMIKTELIGLQKYCPMKIIKDILNIIPYNNRYAKSYLALAKLISDDYHVKEVKNVGTISKILFYKECVIKLEKPDDIQNIKPKDLDIFTENTIYRAIMNNDLEMFITFTERDEFDKNESLQIITFTERDEREYSYIEYSLLELCCFYGAVDCFKLLRTKFNSEITKTCLNFSFLGGNKEIMSECLKYQTPDEACMKYAIISHNIDFVTFLMNEFNIEIDLYYCGKYNNLESFLVYFDQTNDVNKCFINSASFEIPSLCEYFLSHGASINEKDKNGQTALHKAATNTSKGIIELLISHGANINEKDIYGETALHNAAINTSKGIIELLISHGANINEKDVYGETALHNAARNNCKENSEFLISHGANIDEKNNDGNTPLHQAVFYNSKETVELLISHGANIDEKNVHGQTALINATYYNIQEIAQLLILYGANTNEKDNYGNTALHNTAINNSKWIAELLISHGANISEKDKHGNTALHYAAYNNRKEIAEFLISHGAKINEKNEHGKTALHIAVKFNNKEIVELLNQ